MPPELLYRQGVLDYFFLLLDFLTSFQIFTIFCQEFYGSMASFNASHEEILSLNPLTLLGLIFQNFNFINSKCHNTKIYPTKIHISFILLICGLGWFLRLKIMSTWTRPNTRFSIIRMHFKEILISPKHIRTLLLHSKQVFEFWIAQ